MKRVKEHRYMYRRGETLVFRRAVPEHARREFDGHREVLKSLGTASVAEARHRLVSELADFDARMIRAGRHAASHDADRVPTLVEVEAAAREWLTERMQRSVGRSIIDPAISTPDERLADLKALAKNTRRTNEVGSNPDLQTAWVAEALAERNGWRVDPASPIYRQLHVVAGRALIEAARRQTQDLKGKPRKVRDDTFGPIEYSLDDERKRAGTLAPPVSIMTLFDGYVDERKPAYSTVRQWRGLIRKFIEFAGHDDARRITPDDVQAWKEYLLTTPTPTGAFLAMHTVKDTYLSA